MVADGGKPRQCSQHQSPDVGVRDVGVAVDVAVVIEELLAERSCLGDRAEPLRERRTVFQRLELGFAVGIQNAHKQREIRTADRQPHPWDPTR